MRAVPFLFVVVAGALVGLIADGTTEVALGCLGFLFLGLGILAHERAY